MRPTVIPAVSRVVRDDVLRHDLPASLVVFLVAVPLSLGIAVACGAPVTAGLIAAGVGGLVAGVVGGSELQITGPAAGLIVIVAGQVEQFGWKTACALTVAAGLVQVVLGLSRVARAVLAISPSVIHAMLAGIGVTIALANVHVLLGGEPASSPVENLLQLPGQLTGAYLVAVLLGLTGVVVLVLWGRMPGWAQRVPGPLVAVVGLTAIAEMWQLGVARVDLPGSPLAEVQLPDLPSGDWSGGVVASLTLALVASVETLFCAAAVDRLRRGHRSSFDRVLVGQGAANMASGMLGGLPVSGVIVRSSANVAAGARTRVSAILVGVWVLLFTLLLGGAVRRIPMVALAALLVVIGLKLINPAHLRTARTQGELPAYLATVTGVLLLGLLEGVAVGVVVSLVLMMRRVLRARVHVSPAGPVYWHVVAEGALSFLAVPRLTRALAQVPSGVVVILHLRATVLDHVVADHLKAWKRQHEEAGGRVQVDDVALAPRFP